MCGIAGYLGRFEPGLSRRMTSLIVHRGPDDEGEATIGSGEQVAVLAHRRLSIIDLEGGHQPICNEDQTIQVVFNGEIYNFAELRRDLERRGHRFQTRSDTEVLVHLYEDEGDALLQRLRGMFAFALYDARRSRLLLARDRLGKKPLYYTVPDGGPVKLAFASELKCLLEVPGVARDLDHEALAAYLAYLYVPHPQTIVRGIRKLPPGHMLVAQNDRIELSRYWGLDAAAAGAEPADHDRLWEMFEEAVVTRLVADVPVGAFLSGGVDSSSIVAAAAARVPGLSTFTVAFDGPEERLYDESADARIVADAFGTTHHELRGQSNLGELLAPIVRHFDEPFGNPTALLAYALSELTRRYVKVVLGGEGSDELFAGYLRFKGLVALARYRRIPRPARALAAVGARALPESTRGRHALRRAREFATTPNGTLDEAYTSWVTYFDAEDRAALFSDDLRERLCESTPPERFLADLFDQAPDRDLVNRISFVELQSYLPCNVLEYNDKMSMAHGLEIRAPYCDHRLVEYVFSLPGSAKLRGRETKALLRQTLRSRLPARALDKRKVGFNPPMGVWLRGELAPLIDSHLGREQIEARGLLRPEAVERLVRTLRDGRRDVSLKVWSLIVLEQWLREYGDPQTASN
jgi:asparagine synthase (glutamine-hydrolysing)